MVMLYANCSNLFFPFLLFSIAVLLQLGVTTLSNEIC